MVVQTDRGARHVLIRVTDTGCGIPQEELRHLLVPFKQVRGGEGGRERARGEKGGVCLGRVCLCPVGKHELREHGGAGRS